MKKLFLWTAGLCLLGFLVVAGIGFWRIASILTIPQKQEIIVQRVAVETSPVVDSGSFESENDDNQGAQEFCTIRLKGRI